MIQPYINQWLKKVVEPITHLTDVPIGMLIGHLTIIQRGTCILMLDDLKLIKMMFW